MVKIRLMRMGAKKRPFYRVVVADARSPRDGRFIENIGKYQPLSDPSVIEIDEERALHWLRTGAQPSQPVQVLLHKVGIWEQFRPGDAPRARADRGPKVSKKQAARAAEAAASGETPQAPPERGPAPPPTEGASQPEGGEASAASPDAASGGAEPPAEEAAGAEPTEGDEG